MSNTETGIKDSDIRRGLSGIHQTCTDVYRNKNLECPEACVMKIYQRARDRMPTCPLATLYDQISSTVSHYATGEKPKALQCFNTLNSLVDSTSSVDWIPIADFVGNITRGVMDMTEGDLGPMFTTLCNKNVSRPLSILQITFHSM